MKPPSNLPAEAPPLPDSLAAIFAIERPHPKLWIYYLLCSLATGPLFPIVILPNWFRYHTMRYRFDREGISMRWGILFRREVLLNYARIQDIHLVSNFVERWLGLARIQIQTASGSATPEMTLEGLVEFESIRDFLYSRMRGTSDRGVHLRSGGHDAEGSGTGTMPVMVTSAELAAVTTALHEVAEELKALRLGLRDRRSP